MAPVLNQPSAKHGVEIETHGTRGIFTHMANLGRHEERLEDPGVAFEAQRQLAAQPPEALRFEGRQSPVERRREDGSAVEPEHRAFGLFGCRGDEDGLPGVAAAGNGDVPRIAAEVYRAQFRPAEALFEQDAIRDG